MHKTHDRLSLGTKKHPNRQLQLIKVRDGVQFSSGSANATAPLRSRGPLFTGALTPANGSLCGSGGAAGRPKSFRNRASSFFKKDIKKLCSRDSEKTTE